MLGLALLAAIVVAACTGGGTTATTDASGSTVPATRAPDASPSGSSSAGQASPTPISYPLTLVDDEGSSVTLAARPARIVSLTPATTETLFALGAGDRVVGRSDDPTPYPAESAAVPVVATYQGVDLEKVVKLNPDLVIAGGNEMTSSEAIRKMRDLGLPVLVVYANDVAGVLADIALVGAAADGVSAANALTSDMRSRIDAIAAAVATLDHPRTFYEIDATKEIYGPADDSFVAEMVKLAGGVPITTGSTTVFSIPLERLVAADPQVIVLGDAIYGTTPKDVAARPGWADMTAVKAGAVRPVDDTVVTRPGPRLVLGLLALERAIHPEAPVFPPAASESPSAPAPTAPVPAASASPSAAAAAADGR